MVLNTKKVAVIGSGSWATALVKILLENLTEINWYFRNKDNINLFKQFNHNPGYLRGVEFNTNRIKFFSDINKIVDESEILIFAIPSAFLPKAIEGLHAKINDKFVLSGIKGIVPEKNLLVGEYFNKLYNIPFESIGIIAGPCHAEEVALERLSYLTIACTDENKAKDFSRLIECDYIKTGISDDIWGTEYTSVIKNIIAIAAGIVHGLRYGDNFQAVLLSNAIQEIKRFVDKVHPISRDIKSSVYLGDLIVTAYSQFSRNRMFGTMIGKGYSVLTAQLDMHMIAEGYYAAKSINEINEIYNVDMPISKAVYRILYENVSPKREIAKLTEKLS